MAAVQIPFVKKLQTKLQETYYTNLKYKNEVIFCAKFRVHRIVFTPPLFS